MIGVAAFVYSTTVPRSLLSQICRDTFLSAVKMANCIILVWSKYRVLGINLVYLSL